MKRKILSLLVGVALVGTLAAGPLVMDARAGTIQNAYMFLDDMQASQTSGLEFILAVAPATDLAATGTTLTIEFPDGDDGLWCRTAGALGVTGVSSSSVDQGGQAITASLPGTLSASCSQGGVGTKDTITISGIGDTDNTNTYGVQIDDTGAGVLGTGGTSSVVTVTMDDTSNSDNISFELELLDGSVAITADVAAAPTVTCELSTNSVDIATDLIQGGSFQTATHTITASTSTGASGYYWAAYGTGDASSDAGLYKSSATTYLIASTSNTTVDLTAAEGFGMTVSDPDNGVTSEVVPADFQDGTYGQFGALDRLYSGAQMVLYQPAAETSPDVATVTYGARAGLSAETGAYSETVEFVCGGYY